MSDTTETIYHVETEYDEFVGHLNGNSSVEK